MTVTEERNNMISRIAAIGLVGLLVVALIGGSAYILLRPDETGIVRAAGPTNRSESAEGRQGNGYQGGRGAQGQLAGSERGNGYQGGARQRMNLVSRLIR